MMHYTFGTNVQSALSNVSLFTVQKRRLKHLSTHCQFKNINIYVDSYNSNSYTTCAHFSLRFESIMWPNIHYKSIFLLKNVDEINFYYYYYNLDSSYFLISGELCSPVVWVWVQLEWLDLYNCQCWTTSIQTHLSKR